MADQCCCSRVIKFVFILALFVYLNGFVTCSVDGKKAKIGVTITTTAVPESDMLVQTTPDPVSSLRHIKVPKSCSKCIRKCDCQFGVPTSIYSKDSKMCQRCCKRKKCRNFDYKILNELKKAARRVRRQNRRKHRPRSVHGVESMMFQADPPRYVTRTHPWLRPPKHWPKNGTLGFSNGDEITNSQLIIAALHGPITHGFVENRKYSTRDLTTMRLAAAGGIEIIKTGLFHINVQITFWFPSHDHRYGNFLITTWLGNKKTDLAKCSTTNYMEHDKAKRAIYTCSTSINAKLKKGTKILLTCDKKCPYISMKRTDSFYGVTRLE